MLVSNKSKICVYLPRNSLATHGGARINLKITCLFQQHSTLDPTVNLILIVPQKIRSAMMVSVSALRDMHSGLETEHVS